MLSTQIQSCARKYHALLGDHAEDEAAQRIRDLEISGSRDEAEVWRRIRRAIVIGRRARGL